MPSVPDTLVIPPTALVRIASARTITGKTATKSGHGTEPAGDSSALPAAPPPLEDGPSLQEQIAIATRNSAAGTEESEKSASRSSTPAESDATQPSPSAAPLLTLEQESYVQTSLVDDSIRRLHLQMRRLTFDPASESPHKAPVDVDDAAEVTRAKLACATATSMARLLKTKLDAARLFKK